MSCTLTRDRSLSDEEKKKIVYTMYDEYKNDFQSVDDVTPLQAMQMMSGGKVIFVDVRWENEMMVSMLPNAISKKAYLKNPQNYGDRKVIGYCTISYRSGKFARKMAEKGILIYNLRGGLLAWVLEGGKVYDKNGETRRIHVFGNKWNYPPSGYDAVWF